MGDSDSKHVFGNMPNNLWGEVKFAQSAKNFRNAITLNFNNDGITSKRSEIEFRAEASGWGKTHF